MTWLNGVLFRLGRKRVIDGVPVGVILFASGEQQAAAFERVTAALVLLQEHAPVHFLQMRRDLTRIFVCPIFVADNLSQFHASSRSCSLELDWVASPGTSTEAVLGTIVYEAQHARLRRLGCVSDSSGRVERLCFRASRVVGHRLPNGEVVVARATAAIARPTETYSLESRYMWQAEGIRRLSLPSGVERVLLWANKRAERRAITRALSQGRRTTR